MIVGVWKTTIGINLSVSRTFSMGFLITANWGLSVHYRFSSNFSVNKNPNQNKICSSSPISSGSPTLQLLQSLFFLCFLCFTSPSLPPSPNYSFVPNPSLPNSQFDPFPSHFSSSPCHPSLPSLYNFDPFLFCSTRR